ncbi:MAG TPA: ABC transporter ATP-binding protein [Acidimicrobiales bacterium]|nr:ABC transporter ATP-binding protein [Acidimicrobiales bacterium]
MTTTGVPSVAAEAGAVGRPAGGPLMSASNVTVTFGGVRALSDVSIEVGANTITGLVGPNGAGKTTLFGVLSGLLRPDAGRVTFLGEDITGLTPQARARRGLARTFQQPELFMGLTVREHLVLADRVRHQRPRLWKDMFTAASLRRPDRSENERVDAILELLSLQPIAHQMADTLPLGTSRLLEVGRALAAAPRVILLDEPLAGLDVVEAERLALALRRTVEKGDVSLLLVEHDVGMVLSLSSQIYVLDFGVLIAQGPPDEIRHNAEVRAAYLGDEEAVESRTSLEDHHEHQERHQ